MKKLILIIAILLINTAIFAQKYIASFEGGLEIPYTVLDATTRTMNRMNIALTGRYDMATTALTVDYYAPDLMYWRAGIGYGSFGGEAIYFLNTGTKTLSQPITLASASGGANTVIKYVAKVDVQKIQNYGVHGGYYFDGLSGLHQIFVGGSLFRTRQLRVQIPKQTRRGTRQMLRRGKAQSTLNADLMINNHLVGSGDDASSSSLGTAIGFRLLLEGMAGFMGKRDFGLVYNLGFSYYPSYGAMSDWTPAGVVPNIGLGFFVGIGGKGRGTEVVN